MTEKPGSRGRSLRSLPVTSHELGLPRFGGHSMTEGLGPSGREFIYAEDTSAVCTRVVHHADQGSQYTSVASAMHCHRNGVVPSMGSVGTCYHKAMAEWFFATVECELLDQKGLPHPTPGTTRNVHLDRRLV